MFARLLICFALLGCVARSDPPTEPTRVYDVSCESLARDLPSARTYAGQLVRVRLARGTYESVGRELRVRGTVPDAPPLLVFRCRESAPSGCDLAVVGRVLPPARDHVWRTTAADFGVTVEDCTVTRRP